MSNADKATQEIMKLMKMGDQEQEMYFAALPPDGTSTTLVKDLLLKEPSEKRESIIDNAKRYMYDDFKSPHFCGKMKLYKDLMEAGYVDLARNVTAGKYDSNPQPERD